MALQEYDQPTAQPTPKVAAVGVAGAASILVVFVMQSAFKLELTAEVAAAITTLLSFGAGYFKRDAKPVEAVKIIEKDSVKG